MYLIRFANAVFLFWSALAVLIAIGAFTLTARDNLHEGGKPATNLVVTTPASERPRPPGVPADAELVAADVTFGDVSAPPGSENTSRQFYALRCEDHLLTISTTRETIYAELDCDRYWLVDEVVRPFLGRPVRVRIVAGPPATLLIDTIAAGTARFEVAAVWLDSSGCVPHRQRGAACAKATPGDSACRQVQNLATGLTQSMLGLRDCLG